MLCTPSRTPYTTLSSSRTRRSWTAQSFTRRSSNRATGRVAFVDGSGQPDKLTDGDRQEGVAFFIKNYVDNDQGLVLAGTYKGCSAAWCTLADSWTPMPDTTLTYSTADNSRPIDYAGLQCGAGSIVEFKTPGSAGACVCASGYQKVATTGGCELCPVGAFKAAAGDDIMCSPCPGGSFKSSEGPGTCQLCPKGSSQPATGQSQCVPCEAGTVQPSSGSQVCEACEPGYYQAEKGALACVPCGMGFAQPAPAAKMCVPCSPGSAQPSTASTTCVACAAGSAQAEVGALSCIPCPVGSSQPAQGALTCIPCSAGLAQPSSGSMTCEACVQPYSSTAGSGTCNICAAGFFDNALVPSNSTSRLSCPTCPPGAICNAGATTATLLMQRGYWRYNIETEDIHECSKRFSDDVTACMGGAGTGKCARDAP
jgi:hypothetical protein